MRILFLNPQGNFDAEDSYWTEHPDFGGQLVYVKEIARAMAKQGHEVDILTRRFEDEKIQGFHEPLAFYPDTENLRIVRISCGPNHFLAKEALWEHIHEWVENIISFYKEEGTSFDFITTHYGDGGLAGVLLSERTGIPFSFTGHSLGAQKMDKLNLNEENVHSLNETYQFAKRLSAERSAMLGASIVFTSTAQERDEQYLHKAYVGAGDVDHPDKFVIAPPGVNEEIFGVDVVNEVEEQVHQLLDETLARDIDDDRLNLPYIVLASRLDPKKNHLGLLEAYAASPALQAISNVAISLRGVEDAFTSFANLKENEQKIMQQLMSVIDDYNLKGKVTFVNITSQKALAASYRYFSSMRSIFCLTALYEPFGLAPIEAMCAGLPAAVTQYGGPADVLKDDTEQYGVLLDVHDQEQMIKGLMQIFKHFDFYQKQGLHRVKSTYTWMATAKRYIEAIQSTLTHPRPVTLSADDYFKSPSELLSFNIKPIEQYYLK